MIGKLAETPPFLRLVEQYDDDHVTHHLVMQYYASAVEGLWSRAYNHAECFGLLVKRS